MKGNSKDTYHIFGVPYFQTNPLVVVVIRYWPGLVWLVAWWCVTGFRRPLTCLMLTGFGRLPPKGFGAGQALNEGSEMGQISQPAPPLGPKYSFLFFKDLSKESSSPFFASLILGAIFTEHSLGATFWGPYLESTFRAASADLREAPHVSPSTWTSGGGEPTPGGATQLPGPRA